MRLVSVNVGMPRDHLWEGRVVTTGIFKEPVPGRVTVRRLQIDGDGQADLTVHGGRDMAVYAYPAEHYTGYWAAQLPGRPLPWGVFGENLTTEGLLEDEVRVGDVFVIGAVRLVVTQPRLPCFKLGLRFNDKGMVKRFAVGKRPGIYFRVDAEGEVGPGDAIERVHRETHGLTVVEAMRLILDKSAAADELKRAAAVPALAESVRQQFLDRVRAAEAG